MSVVVLFLHPTMADDEDHLPVEPHNFNYGIGRWGESDFFQVADAHQQWEQILSLMPSQADR
jgi:hypothetical protein